MIENDGKEEMKALVNMERRREERELRPIELEERKLEELRESLGRRSR